MIKPAILYKEKLLEKIAETFYDPEYMYYYDVQPGLPDIADKPDGVYQFVSVDENDEVIGFFSYWVYEPTKRAMNFGLIAFKKFNKVFLKDVERMFKDMFEKFGIESIEWRCYEDNVGAVNLYKAVIKKYGGQIAGFLRKNGCPQSRKISNTYLFEILKEDLTFENGTIVPKKGNN